MSRYFATCLIFIGAIFMSVPANASCGSLESDQKIALLIGNSKYDDLNWPALANAVNDIDHVCKAFEKAGYQIIDVRDANISQMREAAEQFEYLAASAESAVVYYAGHGFEYNGRNFMVPVDAPLFASKGELDSLFLPLDNLLKSASRAKKFNLFFMDACRTSDPIVQLKDARPDDPDGSVSSLGLLEMKQGAVFYSTAKGQPALDAAPIDSKISPFAAAIASRLEIPGLELSDYFKVVSKDVYKHTRSLNLGPQQPFHYGSWFEDFYLNEPARISQAEIAQKAEAKRKAEEDRKRKKPKAKPRAPRVLAYQYIPPSITMVLNGLSTSKLAIEDEPVIVAEILENHGVADITLAASTGNAVAQYLLGYMYHFGVGVKEDRVTAVQWLEKSAAQNHPAGLTELAYYLQENEPEEKARALELYRRAAETGFAKAKSHLGFALWSGSLGKADSQEAIALFKQASDAGHPYATFAWGLYGQKQAEARIRLQKLADEGNLEGNNWLCEMDYIKQNSTRLQENCLLAARGGYAGARAIMADLHQRGFGVEQSQKEASFWAKLALQQPELKVRKSLYEKMQNIAVQ